MIPLISSSSRKQLAWSARQLTCSLSRLGGASMVSGFQGTVTPLVEEPLKVLPLLFEPAWRIVTSTSKMR